MTPRSKPRQHTAQACFALLVAFVWAKGNGLFTPARAADRFHGIHFREVTAEVGIDFVHRPTSVDEAVAHIEPQIASTGAGVSIVDANGDEWPDVYATTSADGALNVLYVNRGDGTFDERASEAGLADLNRAGVGCSMGSVWADYDGDGRQDAFIYCWGRSRLFRNLGGLRFEDVTKEAGLDVWVNSNAATWFDYDRDGRLDL